jgi:hypothetical protein
MALDQEFPQYLLRQEFTLDFGSGAVVATEKVFQGRQRDSLRDRGHAKWAVWRRMMGFFNPSRTATPNHLPIINFLKKLGRTYAYLDRGSLLLLLWHSNA